MSSTTHQIWTTDKDGKRVPYESPVFPKREYRIRERDSGRYLLTLNAPAASLDPAYQGYVIFHRVAEQHHGTRMTADEAKAFCHKHVLRNEHYSITNT